MRRVIYFLLIFLCLPALAQVSTEEFARQMIAHKTRIKSAAHFLHHTRPELFHILASHEVEEYMNMHDVPKLQTLVELKAWGYSNQRTLAERLAFFNGNPPKNEAEQDDLKSAIRDLNSIEDQQKEIYLKNKSASKRAALKLIDRVVDVTDTRLMRKKELSIPENVASPGDFIRSVDKDEAAALLADFLAPRYNSCRSPYINF